MLTRLGARPALAPDRPLRLTGLPQGGYRVTVGPAQAQATIAEGETQSLELR